MELELEAELIALATDANRIKEKYTRKQLKPKAQLINKAVNATFGMARKSWED